MNPLDAWNSWCAAADASAVTKEEDMTMTPDELAKFQENRIQFLVAEIERQKALAELDRTRAADCLEDAKDRAYRLGFDAGVHASTLIDAREYDKGFCAGEKSGKQKGWAAARQWLRKDATWYEERETVNRMPAEPPEEET